MDLALSEQIIQALCRREPQAAFVSEIATVVRPMVDQGTVDEALRDLDAEGRIVVAEHPAPDVHLEAVDLRVIAIVPDNAGDNDALQAADAVWSTWLRAFLATHRCQ